MGDPITSEPRQPRKKRHLLLPALILATLALTGLNTWTISAIQSYQFAGQHSVAVIATYTFGTAPGQQILSAGTTGDFTLSVYYGGQTPVQLTLTFDSTNPSSFGAKCRPNTNCSGVDLAGEMNVFIAGQGPIGPSNAGLPGDYQTTATVSLVNGPNDFAGQIVVSPSASVSSFVLSWTGTIQ